LDLTRIFLSYTLATRIGRCLFFHSFFGKNASHASRASPSNKLQSIVFLLPIQAVLGMQDNFFAQNITLPWWESGGNFDPKLTKSGKNQPIHGILYRIKSACYNKMRKL
jgi:hypothetical protein